MTATMEGIRVLEVAEHTFVPAASAVLADWGADVIKVEHVVRGDAMRGLASTGVVNLGTSKVHALWEHSNRGKRSIALDLASPEGIAILYQLAARSDVFLTNKLPSVRQRLALDVEDIRAHNPRIIYVRGSGFGPRGPEADSGGYDMLGFWARSGAAIGAKPHEVDHIPMMPGPGFGDSLGAMTIAGGIAAALFHRATTGEAPLVDVSLLGVGLWAMGAAIALSGQTGKPWEQPPASAKKFTRNALAGVYATSDRKWIALTCLQGFHYWPSARQALSLEHLADDERFASAAAFAEHSPDLSAIIADVIASAPQDEWCQRLRAFRGQWTPVRDSLEVIDDPQVVANEYVLDAFTAENEPFPLVTSPVQFDGAAPQPRRGPDFNQHGDQILGEDLGLDWDAIVDLKVRGVVG